MFSTFDTSIATSRKGSSIRLNKQEPQVFGTTGVLIQFEVRPFRLLNIKSRTLNYGLSLT